MTGDNANGPGWTPVAQGGTTTVRTSNMYPAGVEYTASTKPDTFDVEPGTTTTTTTIQTSSISTQGPLLYELIEDKMECDDKLCCRTGTFKAQFFENEVVVRNSNKWCLFPKRYSVVVIPRFKLIDVTVRKGIVLPCWAQFLALCFLAGGITMLLFGVAETCSYEYTRSSSSSNSYGSSYSDSYGSSYRSSSTYVCRKNGALIAFGSIFMVISVAFYIWACCRSKYFTLLYVKRSVGTRSLFSFLSHHTVVYHVQSDEIPNEEFLVQYVYNPMRDASKSAHVLTHLNMAALCHPLEPRYFPDSMPNKFVPGRKGSPPPRQRPSAIRTAAA